MPNPFDILQDSYMGVISPIIKEKQNKKLGHNLKPCQGRESNRRYLCTNGPNRT